MIDEFVPRRSAGHSNPSASLPAKNRGLEQAGCSEDSVTLIFAADLRYVGQQSELTVPLDYLRTHHDASRIVDVFAPTYKKLYGVNPSHVPIELVTWRVTARGPIIPFHRAMNLPYALVNPRARGWCTPGTKSRCPSMIATRWLRAKASRDRPSSRNAIRYW